MPTSVFRGVRRCALLASAIAVLACAPARAAAECPGAQRVPALKVSDADLRALACVVNRERRRRGRQALRRVDPLDRAAALHAADMVQRDYFDHRSPGGSMPADRARAMGYANDARSWGVAEDLAWGAGSLASPASIVRTWLTSPPHRAVLLAPRFADAGVGIAAGAPLTGIAGAATYTLMVGRVGA